MVSMASWKIKGLNRPLKQKEVRQVVRDNKTSLCAILESHVDVSWLFGVCKSVFKNWEWTSNSNLCDKGTHINLGWDALLMDVMVISQTDQVMHIQVCLKNDKKDLFCSIVYASNNHMLRSNLWDSLCLHKFFIKDKPWVVMGDFNSALHIEDNLMSSSTTSKSM